MIVGCYDLNLYCDAPKCTNGQYGLYPSQLEATAETGAECRREARRLGWWLSQKHGTCACPPCARAGQRPHQTSNRDD